MQVSLIPIAKATEIIQSDESGIMKQFSVLQNMENTLIGLAATSMSAVSRDVANCALIAFGERKKTYFDESIPRCEYLMWFVDIIPVALVLTRNPLHLDRTIVESAQTWMKTRGISFLISYEFDVIKQLPLYATISTSNSRTEDIRDQLSTAVGNVFDAEYGK